MRVCVFFTQGVSVFFKTVCGGPRLAALLRGTLFRNPSMHEIHYTMWCDWYWSRSCAWNMFDSWVKSFRWGRKRWWASLKAAVGSPRVRKHSWRWSRETWSKNLNSSLSCHQPAPADCSEEPLRDGIPNDTAAAIATNCFDLIYFSFYSHPSSHSPPSHCSSSFLPPPTLQRYHSVPLSVFLSFCLHKYSLHRASGREHLSRGAPATQR